jgi:hypothetical protein
VSDYTEHGSVPIEDAAVENPPTVDEVLERQREEYPEQAATSTQQPGAHRDDAVVAQAGQALSDDEVAALDAGAAPTGDVADGHPELEGPNTR